jgi:hypothetical protein
MDLEDIDFFGKRFIIILCSLLLSIPLLMRHILTIKIFMNSTIQNLTWTVAPSAEEVEKNAFFAGFEADGKKVYVGRAKDTFGNFVPAKIMPDLKTSFFERDGREISTETIEYLAGGDYDWIKSSSGITVPEAIRISGYYVGRGLWNGNVVVGRIDLNSKQLIASYRGNPIKLSEYDVLTMKQDIARKQDILNGTSLHISENKATNSSVQQSVAISSSSETHVTSSAVKFEKQPLFNKQIYFEMMNKIQTLELELATHKHEREAYENRIDFEQKRVEDLSSKLKALRLENSTLTKERTVYEERITTESKMSIEMESKLQGILVDNSYLLKKVTSLEEALKYERYQMATFNDKYRHDISSSGSVQMKIKNFEETIRKQQQRVLELESIIESTNSNSTSLTQQIKTYENTTQSMKVQMESMLKKLQSSNADNEFLVKKLSLLTQSLKNYQFQMEAMSRKLQSSKMIIASVHAEMSKSNAQISKYQAALSSCYVLNGELMTKLSGFNSMSQFQGSFDSKFDILNLNTELSSTTTTSKSISFSATSSILEAAGSDSYMEFFKANHENGTDSESGSQINY